MTAHRHPFDLALLALLATLATGCERLQVGYYLTPGNLPTLPPSLTPSPELTSTPPSTVQGFVTPTLTPFGATAGPPTATATATIVPCEESEGQIVEDVLFSPAANHDVRYRVYLPPCYASTERRYPVLYMLHGLGEGMDDSQWPRMGLATAADLGYQRGSLPPLIIVMPNGNDANYIWDAGPFPGMVLDDLIPTIESRFCAWSDPAMRAIGGLSRGGYWAYWIGLSHPELFARVGGHSAFFYDADYSTDENPNNLVDAAPGLDQVRLYLDHGADDHLVDESVRDFVERLRRRGIEPEYVVNPIGDHNEDYWSAHTADYLAFYTADWPRDVMQYPSCHSSSP